ncbi:PAS/PAC sensor signal transduction histidine kinase [Desulfarculus baarsii DSM 2075]|uniref:histidine kinase n=1 Tax=Desulfarculus baarsii (strain ATCC 33931 / DSM 2075 / LMG 7858 / VKM B-1802 / 2st14) TaxID=644282 RepID=E1QIX9_DESB2|nr:PAS domain-containing protein [Desulfarculus baarsii]ADK85522.1 PAS/PAC sensor signal transduction histidine kinase [Desulfarculus baarsii DSM 2075]
MAEQDNARAAMAELIFQALPTPTLVLNEHMVVQDVNRAFLTRYDLGRADVLGRRCFEVFHSQSLPCPPSRCRFRAAMSGHTGQSVIHEFVGLDGQAVIEEVALSPLVDERGRVIGVIETIRDVTKAKLMENALIHANEFLNRVMDSMVDAVVVADLKGKVLLSNHQALKILEIPPGDEITNHRLQDFCPLEELRRLRKSLDQGGGRAEAVRTFLTNGQGQRVPVLVNSAVVTREGKPVATVGVFHDLRHQIQLERHLSEARLQVVQSDKLARLGQLAAGVAHELNNPLTGITIYAELVKESLPPDSPLQDDMTNIVEDAQRCRDIVKDLLDYSRQTTVRVEDLDLNQVIEDAFNLIRDDALFLHVDVVRDYHKGPLTLEGDEKLLRQVFINLLSNAIDAMAGRGRLTVRTGLDGQGMRWAEISDTGPGIAPEHLDRIFDPFFTTKAPGKGTGLGLSVVYGVVSRAGGAVEVKNTGPNGTTFKVSLPEKADQSLKAFAEVYMTNPSGDVAP